MQGWHEKNILDREFPFKLWSCKNMEFSGHWHEEIEIIYTRKGTINIGVNDEIYTMKEKDVLLIGGGDIHYFIPSVDYGEHIFIQFGLSLFDTYSLVSSDRRFVKPHIEYSNRLEVNSNEKLHLEIEKQILLMIKEYSEKQEGYKMALKARIYDLMLLIIRNVPKERQLHREKIKHLKMIERLEKVFQYIEENFDREIDLKGIAKVANYSPYHFTKFFKDVTGMTFLQYLNNYRIKKAERLLLEMDESITNISFKCGFNSIKTFNRVFKELNKCSPTEFKNRNI